MRIFHSFDFVVPVVPSSSGPHPDTSSTFVREKNPPHYWSNDQKKVLCVLERWFYSPGNTKDGKISSSDKRLIICTCFPDDFPRPSEITERAIISQFNQMRIDGVASEAYREVYLRTSFQDPRGRWNDVKKRIYTAAASIPIDIRINSTDDSHAVLKGASSRKARRKHRRASWSPGVLGYRAEPFDMSEDSDGQPSPRSKISRHFENLAISSPSGCAVSREKSVLDHEPSLSCRIGYRWYDEGSVFPLLS